MAKPESDEDNVQVLGATLHAELSERGLTLATAESLTGGGLGDLVSAAPGASETYRGGVVTYATGAKVGLLGVSDETVEEHGVVSGECAQQMAAGVRRMFETDWGVATTGVAGPTTQEGKPVGTVFVGLAGPDGERAVELHLDGERAEVRRQACEAAVDLVLESLRPQ